MKTGKQKFRKTVVVRALMTAFCGTASFMVAHEAMAQQSLERVEVTGSALRRSIEGQSALPVTVLSVEELKSTGVTSVEEIVQHITSSQSSFNASQSVGSGNAGGANKADLRGIGTARTLVLLNGRRLAFFGFDAGAVDLNAIPFSMIDRVEVLRDGASAFYGTDAVGGVINFITRKEFRGLEATAEVLLPKSSDGMAKRISISGGKGALATDGYNLSFSADLRRQNSLAAQDRDFAKTGIIPDRLNKSSGTSFPANFNYTDTTGAVKSFNTSAAGGCAPPLSFKSGNSCRYDYSGAIDILPVTDTTTLMGLGSFDLGSRRKLSIELLHADNKSIDRVAGDPVTGLTMPTSSPFYPGSAPGIDATQGIFGIGWRTVQAGQREQTQFAKADRAVVDLTGDVAGWDYRTGLFVAQSTTESNPTGGYINKARIQSGVTSGLLNPFGTNSAAALDYINSAVVKTGTAMEGRGKATGFDARATRDMFQLAGGAAQVSLGFEIRRETYKNDTNDDLVNSTPSMGFSPYHSEGGRTVSALSGEALFPVTKQLELTVQARYDKYSDFGSTFNPKLGALYTVSKDLIFRGSANTGFRAPTLDDVFGPQQGTFSADAYDDPVLCPGGTAGAGAIESRDCGQQVQLLQGGNRNLKPEKSKSFTLGTAFRPLENLSFTVDYWNIRLKDKISAFPEQTAITDPTRVVRCNQLSAADQALWERCQIVGGSNAIAYVKALTDNLGGVKTDGIDLTASWFTKVGGVGRLSVNWDGTWVHSYKYQNTADGPWIQNVGSYQDATPIFRWQHVFTTTLDMGVWKPSLAIRYKSGYLDQNTDLNDNFVRVNSYTLVDVGVTYAGIKNLTLNAGIRNLFDTKPPFTNQGTMFQQGYDPRYTDPLMRSLFLRATYKFM